MIFVINRVTGKWIFNFTPLADPWVIEMAGFCVGILPQRVRGAPDTSARGGAAHRVPAHGAPGLLGETRAAVTPGVLPGDRGGRDRTAASL